MVNTITVSDLTEYINKCSIISYDDMEFLKEYSKVCSDFPSPEVFKNGFCFEPFLEVIINKFFKDNYEEVYKKFVDFFKSNYFYFLDVKLEKYYFVKFYLEGYDVFEYFNDNMNSFVSFSSKKMNFFSSILLEFLNVGVLKDDIFLKKISPVFLFNLKRMFNSMDIPVYYFNRRKDLVSNFVNIVNYFWSNNFFKHLNFFYPNRDKFVLINKLFDFLMYTGDFNRVNYILSSGIELNKEVLNVIEMLTYFASAEKKVSDNFFNYLISNSFSLYYNIDLYRQAFFQAFKSIILNKKINFDTYEELFSHLIEVFNDYYKRIFEDIDMFFDYIVNIINMSIFVSTSFLAKMLRESIEKNETKEDILRKIELVEFAKNFI